MADSITLTYRPLFLEDLGTSAVLGQSTTTIQGLGTGILVTPIVTAISDTAAAALGLSIGDVYLETGIQPLRLRAMGPFGSGGGGGGSGVTKLTGSMTETIGSIEDGTVLTANNTIGIAGVFVGDFAAISCIPALPEGVQAFGKIVASGIVTIEIWNLSGGSVTPGNISFNASVIH